MSVAAICLRRDRGIELIDNASNIGRLRRFAVAQRLHRTRSLGHSGPDFRLAKETCKGASLEFELRLSFRRQFAVVSSTVERIVELALILAIVYLAELAKQRKTEQRPVLEVRLWVEFVQPSLARRRIIGLFEPDNLPAYVAAAGFKTHPRGAVFRQPGSRERLCSRSRR